MKNKGLMSGRKNDNPSFKFYFKYLVNPDPGCTEVSRSPLGSRIVCSNPTDFHEFKDLVLQFQMIYSRDSLKRPQSYAMG